MHAGRHAAGRTAEADAIAAHIRTAITRNSSRWLRNTDTMKSAKEAWAKVREVKATGPMIRSMD